MSVRIQFVGGDGHGGHALVNGPIPQIYRRAICFQHPITEILDANGWPSEFVVGPATQEIETYLLRRICFAGRGMMGDKLFYVLDQFADWNASQIMQAAESVTYQVARNSRIEFRPSELPVLREAEYLEAPQSEVRVQYQITGPPTIRPIERVNVIQNPQYERDKPVTWMKDTADDNPDAALARILKKAQRHL